MESVTNPAAPPRVCSQSLLCCPSLQFGPMHCHSLHDLHVLEPSRHVGPRVASLDLRLNCFELVLRILSLFPL